jgi:hypothetical protein
MRYSRRLLTVGLSVLSLLALSFTAFTVSAGAATLPGTVNEVVAATASLSAVGCPSTLATSDPSATTFTSLQAAVTAATNGQTIYVCAGSYDMTTYPNGQVVIHRAYKSLSTASTGTYPLQDLTHQPRLTQRRNQTFKVAREFSSSLRQG